MIILDHPKTKLEYDPAKERLTQTWIGFTSAEEFRTAIDMTVEFSLQYPVIFIISDALEQAVVNPKEADYAASKMPDLIKNGLKAMAFVVPVSDLTQLSVQKFDKQAYNDMIRYFPSKLEAEKWLDSLKV
jgi:hypothetical protein